MNPINPQYAYQQMQQMFPQPQGSVYSINSAAEIGNVPIGSTGLSVGICLQEGLMYIKSFQNGNPIIMPYRIEPYAAEANAPAASSPDNSMEERLARIEKLIEDKGGKFNGLL